MRFNRIIFDNYLATDEGKNALAFFLDLRNVFQYMKQDAYLNFLNHVIK